MQLQACLLLLIVTADTALALSRHPCGGNVSLDQHLAGHISLIVSEPFSSSNTTVVTLNSTSDQSNQSNETLPLSVCTWMISIPPGRTVLFKLLWLETGSSASVLCLGNGHVLEIDGSALLSDCGGHKASLSWTGVGHSSNPIELSYYVQEDEKNSSGGHAAGSGTDPDLVHQSQTGTSFTSPAPVAREAVEGTEWSEGRLHEGAEEWPSGPSPSLHERQLPHATSHPHGSTLAGNADRETLSLPEEGQNNGTDTSGATHRADGPIYTPSGSHPYFEPTPATDSVFDTSHPTKTQTDSSERLPEIQTLLKLGTTAASDATMVADIHKLRDSRIFEASTTQEYRTVPSSRIPNLTSALPDMPSWEIREAETILGPQGGAVSSTPREALQFSWRGQRSTDMLNSELTSAITLDPSPLLPEQQQDVTSRAPTGTESASSSTSEGPSTLLSSTAAPTGVPHHIETASLTHRRAQTATDVAVQTNDTQAPDGSEDDDVPRTFTPSALTRTDSPERTESPAHFTTSSTSSPVSHVTEEETPTATSGTHGESVNTDVSTQTATSSGIVDTARTSVSTATDKGPVLAVQNPATTETPAGTKTDSPIPSNTGSNELLTTNSPTLSPRTTVSSSTPSHTDQTHSPPSATTVSTHTSSPSPLTNTQSPGHVTTVGHRITSQKATVKSASSQMLSSPPSPSSSRFPMTSEKSHNVNTPELPLVLPVTTASSEHHRRRVVVTKEYEPRQGFTSSVTVQPALRPEPRSTLQPGKSSPTTPATSVLTTSWSSTSRPNPKFYIVPDQPADIKVESIELLLQIIVEEAKPASAKGLEEDAAVWVKSHLQSAPGFSRLLEVWSSGHAVQCVAEFKTSAALQWLGVTGPASLLERTGLAHPGASFTSARIINVTLGGLQADVCDWLLECQAGFKCTAQRGSSNYSCSSHCHFDYCHHHGICTHHPGQLPLCHCQAGEDTWYMGQKCDVRMTRARLVAACLAVLLVMVAVIGTLAFLAVRRYRALLIQAKVDQTRSSYRRFNHFDELSGRFWLRSWAESADSLDNPAFTRSDELLHLRALDRPCCYHDDTLSLASTCPSHGARINTIYPHSSQYAWRGSEMSVGDGVLDSGKASDLSVCSWPVEPIQWTPFPLLQQLASHRAPANQVRVSRPRSYCEGMELVDMGKSWTA